MAVPPSLHESLAVPEVVAGDTIDAATTAAIQQEACHQANQDRHRREKEKRLREIHEENSARAADSGVPHKCRDGPAPVTGAARIRREQKAKAKAKAIAKSGAFAAAKAKSVARKY